MKIESPAFKNNGMIPSKYTCDGNNINPQLNIFNVPETAKSLALIVEDPDAQIGTFTHWIVWNIDPATKEISENSNAGGAEGKNDFKRSSYDGPCPNSGTHRYVFKLFALDTTLTLPANSDKKSLEAAMNGHVISSVDVVGLYSRK
ncbi:MAG: YbhB/YbcL family Raf kinase inhibitor-like protein [Patescibacteria group bacterium]|nr:YbhB/YbcL family Raf kinase inhibitor-like protein [Patescibacteria group bacterium]